MKEFYSVVTNRIDTEILNNTLASEVVILSELEWEVPSITTDIVNQYSDKKITVVLGSFDTPNPITETIYWPTFWINWTLENLRWVAVPELDIKYPFITLNNRSHYHRCVFIDELSKQNLIDKGIVTWVKHLNENSDYPYKHFDNRQLLLDDSFNTKLDSFLLAKEYNQSLFHVITEATHKATFITEKTMIPTFLKKPYIVLANKGYNRKLVELGFELYDEIFDYSFDDVDDIFVRTELFVNNVHRTLNCNMDTYNMLLPKIIRNYNRAIEIAKDKSYIPDIIKEVARLPNSETHIIYGRYVRFLND